MGYHLFFQHSVFIIIADNYCINKDATVMLQNTMTAPMMLISDNVSPKMKYEKIAVNIGQEQKAKDTKFWDI